MENPRITAEVIEACRLPPPVRPDWYVVLYVTGRGEWTILREKWGNDGALAVHTTSDGAAKRIAERGIREYRIVKIPGESQ